MTTQAYLSHLSDLCSLVETCPHTVLLNRERYDAFGWYGCGDCEACGSTVMAPDAPTAHMSIR